MANQHSPLPWRAEISDGIVTDLIAADGGHAYCGGHEYDEYPALSPGDAEFIVRAVNNHADLLAALKVARAFCPVGAQGQIDAAIAKAEADHA